MIISFLPSTRRVHNNICSLLLSFHSYFLPIFTHSIKFSLKRSAVTKKMYIFAAT